MTLSRTVAGIDAGASATAVVAWLGDRYATARGASANPTVVGVECAAEAIAAAVRRAAGEKTAIEALFVGAAGAGRAHIAAGLRTALASRFPGAAVDVEDDLRIALRAAIADGPGLILIAGTGAVAYAEIEERRVVVGGEGYVLGDAGSGFWIGRKAVRALARALDGRAEFGPLARATQRAIGAATRAALLELCYVEGRVDVAAIAALAPCVISLSAEGEAEASSIVDEAVCELTELASVAVMRSGLDGDARIALGGGLLSDGFFAGRVEERIASVVGASFIRQPFETSPEFAALRLAMTLARPDART